MTLHELLDELEDAMINRVGVNWTLEFGEKLKEIDLNLKISDRFYEIAPDIWEKFKKEIEEE